MQQRGIIQLFEDDYGKTANFQMKILEKRHKYPIFVLEKRQHHK